MTKLHTLNFLIIMGLIIRIPEFPLNMDCLHVAQPNHALSLSANDQRVEMILTTDAYHYTCMVDYSLLFHVHYNPCSRVLNFIWVKAFLSYMKNAFSLHVICKVKEDFKTILQFYLVPPKHPLLRCPGFRGNPFGCHEFYNFARGFLVHLNLRWPTVEENFHKYRNIKILTQTMCLQRGW